MREKAKCGFLFYGWGGFLAFPEFGWSSAILKKGEATMADEFFRKGLRGALGWGMALGAVSVHAARPFGDAGLLAFAPFTLDNKAFGLAKKCA
mgnify:CR=1 FL=1